MTLSNPTYLYPNQESLIADQISNQFYLPYAIVKTHLENYYILHWQGIHLINEINFSLTVYKQEAISREGIKYLVKFDDGLTAWHLVNHPSEQYKLSFRRANNDLYGTVLIRKIGA